MNTISWRGDKVKTAILDRFVFSDEVRDIIENAPEIIIPESRKEILDLATSDILHTPVVL